MRRWLNYGYVYGVCKIHASAISQELLRYFPAGEPARLSSFYSGNTCLANSVSAALGRLMTANKLDSTKPVAHKFPLCLYHVFEFLVLQIVW